MLELRVWAECRPIHERDTHSHQLIQELEAIDARENEQGSSFCHSWAHMSTVYSLVPFDVI
jgi:hypothetical protein